jgi:hypothetical protein
MLPRTKSSVSRTGGPPRRTWPSSLHNEHSDHLEQYVREDVFVIADKLHGFYLSKECLAVTQCVIIAQLLDRHRDTGIRLAWALLEQMMNEMETKINLDIALEDVAVERGTYEGLESQR